MKAVPCKLVGRDIVPNAAGLGPGSQQIPDHVAQVPLGAGNMLVPMQECRKLAVTVAVVLMRNEREGLEDGFELPPRITGLVADLGEIFEVARDLAFVPGEQDGLDVGEVFVQRRPSDAGFLGDLRHRHRQQPVAGHQCRSSV